MKLDKFDAAILAALQQDARTGLAELGQTECLTSSPCWSRIKRMEEAGVIEGYTATTSANCAKVCTKSPAYGTANPASSYGN